MLMIFFAGLDALKSASPPLVAAQPA